MKTSERSRANLKPRFRRIQRLFKRRQALQPEAPQSQWDAMAEDAVQIRSTNKGA